MPFKNLIILLTSVIIVVGGGFLISQNRDGTSPTHSSTPQPSFAHTSPTTSPSATPSRRPTMSSPVAPSPSATPESTPTASPSPSASITPRQNKTTIISFTNDGYIPAKVTIEHGTFVIFKNDGTSSMWPASDDHSTHEKYPGSGSNKCPTAPDGTLFDPCKPVQPGQSWTFQFNEVGTWGFHDHLSPTLTGTITVTGTEDSMSH